MKANHAGLVSPAMANIIVRIIANGIAIKRAIFAPSVPAHIHPHSKGDVLQQLDYNLEIFPDFVKGLFQS